MSFLERIYANLASEPEICLPRPFSSSNTDPFETSLPIYHKKLPLKGVLRLLWLLIQG